MEGWNIFAHSVRMVARNWKEALKIFLVPGLLAGVVFVVLIGLIAAGDQGDIGAGSILLVVIGVIAAFLILFWSVVSWHRFVLLEEYPSGWLPPFHLDRILSYLGHGLLLGLVGIALMIPVGNLIGLGSSAGGAIVVLAIPIYFFVAVVMYRLVAILPAAAIGKPLSLRESWDATKGASGSIIVLMIVTFIVNFLVQIVGTLIGSVVPGLGELAVLPVTVFLSMVNVSVLTTFYGLYIEGRDID
ncbi:MAG: hypothetical protein ACU0BK_01440 [Shimia sp.]|uniref:hypothetical protein n=1 Tax=Shimia sp. TaxID=1954381 RepID=UPI0040588E14